MPAWVIRSNHCLAPWCGFDGWHAGGFSDVSRKPLAALAVAAPGQKVFNFLWVQWKIPPVSTKKVKSKDPLPNSHKGSWVCVSSAILNAFSHLQTIGSLLNKWMGFPGKCGFN